MPSIAAHLASLVTKHSERLLVEPNSAEFPALAPGVHQGDAVWSQVVSWCHGECEDKKRFPSERLGFVAKRLAVHERSVYKVVLATPLYVEMLD
jgi:hypothetical protein